MGKKKNPSRRPEYKQKKKNKGSHKFQEKVKTSSQSKKKYVPLIVILAIFTFACLLAIGIRKDNKHKSEKNEFDTIAESTTTVINSASTSTESSFEDIVPNIEDISSDDDLVNVGDAYTEDVFTTGEQDKLIMPLEVHFIDVGQGDSILITCAGESMLIDAGNEYKGTTVQLYLTKHNIDSLKYLVASHPDADHIGGLDVIVTKYDIENETIWMPNIIRDTQAYADLVDAVEYREYKMMSPEIGAEYPLGDAKINIVYATDESLDDNDKSLVVKVNHGELSFLFTGDISNMVEVELANRYDLASNVLKVSHHGSQHSTTQEFIDLVRPSFAVFSVGDNSYGHPDSGVAERLSDYGCKLFRTDEQGSVIAVSDGKEITFNVTPCDFKSFDRSIEEIDENSIEDNDVIT